MKEQSEFWNKMSKAWSKWSDSTLRPRQDLHDRLIDNANVLYNSTILDLATGIGEPGISAAKRVSGTVFGCDVSNGMLEIARERAKKELTSNYLPTLLKEPKFPFENDSLDAAICSFGLEFMDNPGASIEEVFRVLKPESTFSVATWGPFDRNPIQNIVLEDIPSAKDVSEEPIWKFSNPETLSTLLEKSGFVNIRHTGYTGAFTFKDFEELWEFKTESSAPAVRALQSLNKGEVEAVKQKVAERSKNYEANGHLKLPFFAWIYSADKPSAGRR